MNAMHQFRHAFYSVSVRACYVGLIKCPIHAWFHVEKSMASIGKPHISNQITYTTLMMTFNKIECVFSLWSDHLDEIRVCVCRPFSDNELILIGHWLTAHLAVWIFNSISSTSFALGWNGVDLSQ